MTIAPTATRSLPRAALATLSFVLFLTFLDTTIVSVVLANVQNDLHTGVIGLQWVVSGYALVFASLMLTFGTLGDLFGRKKIMLGGVAVFCAGSLIAAVAPNVQVLIAGRLIMGLGAAASEPGTLSMIRHIYPDRQERARALGVWAAVSGLALALGPVIGGVLAGVWSWRAVFWFNVFFGLVALVLAAWVLPENSDPTNRRLDVPGFLLSAIALGAASIAVIAGETAGYASGWIDGLFSLALLAAIGFVVFERRAANPVLNVRYFRIPAFGGSNFVAFSTYFSTFAIFFFVSLYLEEVGTSSPYAIAVDFIPMAAGLVLTGLFTGRWVAARGPPDTDVLRLRAGRRGAAPDRRPAHAQLRAGQHRLDVGPRRDRIRHGHRAGDDLGVGRHPAPALRHGGIDDQHQPRAGGRRRCRRPGLCRERPADG